MLEAATGTEATNSLFKTVQRGVLRAYDAEAVTHLALSLPDADAGRALLADLVPGGHQELCMTVENDQASGCLNVGLTYAGLVRLEVPEPVLAEFPRAFREGAAHRSKTSAADDGVGIGDLGRADPGTWSLGAPSSEPHLVLSLWSDVTEAGHDEQLAALLGLCAQHGATVVAQHMGRALGDGRLHFGYRDGISQVHIAGGAPPLRPNFQPPAPTGDFVLGCGHRNSYGGNFAGHLPGELADDATYAVLRVMAQDVAAFEQVLDDFSARSGLEREAVAAQLMGRWRDGTPLALASHEALFPDADLDRFDYGPSNDGAWVDDDPAGRFCPVGSHIRRMNPRHSLVMGKPHSHRLVRRGMPYGPRFDPGCPDDGIERGLLGFFICGDIELQFEFILRAWANQDMATTGIRGMRDPVIGTQPPGGGHVRLRTDDGIVFLDGLPQLVHTVGSLYLFLPGLSGLRHLASCSPIPS